MMDSLATRPTTIKTLKIKKPIKIENVFDHVSKSGYPLWNYQKEGIKWMLEKEKCGTPIPGRTVFGGLLCDEPGLGKTIQTVSTLYGNPKKKTLIILPNSLIYQWKTVIENILPNKKIYIHYGLNKCSTVRELISLKFDILITTVGMIYKKTKDPADDCHTILHHYGNWDRIIFDEVHSIRNSRSKISRMVNDLKSNIKWGLTGTPIQNSIRDLYSLYKFLNIPKKFLDKECLVHLNDLLLLRRTKKTFEKEIQKSNMPKLIEYDHILEYETESERNAYRIIQKTIEKEYNNIVEDEDLTENLKVLAFFELLIRLRQASVHPKIAINSLSKKFGKTINIYTEHSTKIETISNMISKTKNLCLIFCHFREEMKLMAESLKSKNINSRQYHGGLDIKSKNEIIKEFSNSDLDDEIYKTLNMKGLPHKIIDIIIDKINKPQVLIIQIKAGGVGLNLQQFSEVYFTLPDWNPANEIQAIARAHRIGQDKPVIVNRFLMFDQIEEFSTIDQRIAIIQRSKRDLMSEILNDTDLEHKGIVNAKNLKTIKLIEKLNSNDFHNLLGTS